MQKENAIVKSRRMKFVYRTAEYCWQIHFTHIPQQCTQGARIEFVIDANAANDSPTSVTIGVEVGEYSNQLDLCSGAGALGHKILDHAHLSYAC